MLQRLFSCSRWVSGFLAVVLLVANGTWAFVGVRRIYDGYVPCHGQARWRQKYLRPWDTSSVKDLVGSHLSLSVMKRDQETEDRVTRKIKPSPMKALQTSVQSASLALAFGLTCWTTPLLVPATETVASAATDSTAIVGCLFKKCAFPLAKCVANPKCLANVICINTCNGRPDEIDCQIKCGNLFENDVVGEFNKCAVSEMDCVPQQPDGGEYPALPTAPNQLVSSFDPSKFFDGRLYITAGQNPLFDTFPCQVHFFTPTGPNSFFGKLNWRITEPDGEFFTRDAVQAFVQDPDQPAHLLNHDNEYLHYQDDWWIIDYEYDGNREGIPPFAFVYYRGSNDAWDGYGGAVVYTKDASLPKELLPRLRVAANKVNFDFDKDFEITDNSCPATITGKDKALLREKFAGKVALQTEEQIRAQATRFRGNAANSIKAQKLFMERGLEPVKTAVEQLEETTRAFEEEAVRDVIKIEQEAVKDVVKLEKETVKDVIQLEESILQPENSPN